ncbi:restriction endonuclease subunit S [Candidatus Uabimicrobium amorphum]|uniref:Restriction modification system DNA specificity domain-containing protein n=1 Tax=Uabimicrobium amorphum TaxID=2596890 RepID=A0A5S9F5I6_UABAM|nr:restriction endonuclease subunit S [Candidatus Uabimicrobium amorphum]BBM86642.1 restriction modification system DNA specificity domain-containing protein [Candidatus Uabimicrobium amorphum]
MSYQPYPEYKDSVMPKTTKIPNHWSLEKIKFNSYVKGRVGWQNLRKDEYTELGPYLVTGAHFDKKDGVNWEACYHVSEERYQLDKDIWIKKNDLLMTKDGTIGKIAHIKELPGKACLNSHLLIIRDLQQKYIARYAYYLLISPVFKVFVALRQSGTTFHGITQEAVEEFKLILPPLLEQKAIATFLDRETAKIDKIIAKQQKLIELLQEKRQAVISHAVTKGLDPNVKMKDSGVEWLGEIPEHWDSIKLKLLTVLLKDGTHSSFKRVDEGYRLLGVRNIRNDLFIFRDDDSKISEVDFKTITKSFLVMSGDIQLGIIGGIGKVALVQKLKEKFATQRNVATIRVNKRVINKFLFYFFKSFMFQNYLLKNAGYSAQPAVYLGTLGSCNISTPSLTEQKNIITYLNQKTAKIDVLINKTQTAIALLKEKRIALITAAVTGKIDVRNEVTPKEIEEAQND